MSDEQQSRRPGGRREPMFSRADVDTAIGPEAAKMSPAERFGALMRGILYSE